MINLPTNNSSPLSLVDAAARVHPTAEIGPFSIIEADVEIGENTVIGSHVTIKAGTRIGAQSYIASNTFIFPETHQLEFWNEKPLGNNGKRPVIEIGDRVHVEPNVTIHGEVSIGDHCWIGSNVTIYDGARLGKNVKIFPGAVISAIPQDLKFKGEKTLLEIGDNTIVRECATLNRGTEYHGKTVIGANVLIMAYVHVAHDCIIGDHVIIANAVNIAGHVEIGDYVVVGGVSAFHQFVKVGKHAMISGGSLVRKDVPPFVKAGREPVQYEGVNSIGLRRRGFETEVIHQVQEIYRHVFLSGRNTANALDYIETHLPPTEERDEVITFIRKADRGIIKGHGQYVDEED